MFLVLPFYHNYTEDESWIKTGFFVPAYISMNKKEYVGNRGEYLIEKQKSYYNNRRATITDPLTLLEHKSEQPFTAEEAFAAEGVNKFNKIKISEQIISIRIKKLAPEIQRGYMEFVYNSPDRKRENIIGVKFKPHPKGPIHILEHPLWEQENLERVNNLYVGGIDGIDIGASETSIMTKDPSKFCTTIKRRIYGMKEPMYVAYYMDRPDDIREAYKLTIALLWYYQAQANIEATRLSVLTYARDNKFMLFFMKRPRVCYGDNIKRRTANLYGTTATTAMISHLTDLLALYVEDYCHNIWFIEFLELLNLYTDENKGKFDIVASMAMCELADEELNDIVPREKKTVSLEFQDIGYYKDERGYIHFGVIPKSPINTLVRASWDNLYDGRNITSDPRYK